MLWWPIMDLHQHVHFMWSTNYLEDDISVTTHVEGLQYIVTNVLYFD